MISPYIASNGSEKKNLLYFLLLHPFYLVRFAIKSPSRIFMYLVRRQISQSGSREKKIGYQFLSEGDKKLYLERFPSFRRMEIIDIDDFEEIGLASCTVSSRQQLDWSYINGDIENTFSLNRFGWLLTAIHIQPSAKLASRSLEWITNWIDIMGESFHHPAWESYSVSERLANWPFILRVIERFQPLDRDTEKKIAEAMGTHIDYLLQNLELPGKFTNNHILNNARGLYIGGLLVEHKFAVEKAKELFMEWTPKLFHIDGMLKEGSSHYQFLLCQRFEQVCVLSHLSGDAAFASFMKKWTEAIRRARDFFNIHGGDDTWTMPLIGDISPDYKPIWFSPLSMGGWEVIKNSYAQDNFFTSCNKSMHAGLRKMCEGFFRYDQDDVTIFWHASGVPAIAGSHSHFDLGSFILFLKGEGIFIDAGRRSYNLDESTGVYAKAHNGLIIDGFGPFCEDYRLNLIDAYPHQISHTVVEAEKDNHIFLTLSVDGFRRLVSPVSWERTFSFKEKTMTIRDDIKAKGGHELETRFIIAAGLSAEKTAEGVCIKSKKGQVTMKVKVLNSDSDGPSSFFMDKAVISREYGRSEDALAFVVKNTTRGNHKNIYEIKWHI
jgi:hypothetical protein